MVTLNCGFSYIDDDLQNLQPMVNFRLEELVPSECVTPSCSSANPLSISGPDSSSVTQPTKGMHGTASGDTAQSQVTILDVHDNRQASSQAGGDGKPPFHYADLIEFALRDKNQLTVGEIYDWILQRFPYFKEVDENKWKPAVRHTLTTNSAFYKCKKVSRGFMWAVQSPESVQNMKESSYNANSETCNNHWKRQKLGEYRTNVIPPLKTSVRMMASDSVQVKQSSIMHPAPALCQVQPLLSAPTYQVDSTSPQKFHSHCSSKLLVPNSRKHSTIILDSDDELDEVGDPDNCGFRVECVIPKLPSEMDINDNANTDSSVMSCVPCCRDSRNPAESGCCRDKKAPKLETKLRLSSISEWIQLLHDLHDPDTDLGSVNNRAMPQNRLQHYSNNNTNTRINPEKTAVKKESLKSKVGQVVYLPISTPVYKKAAALKRKDEVAQFHIVPKEVAVHESGLFEEHQNLSRLSAVPSTHTICSSLSSTRALEEMFEINDLHSQSLTSLPMSRMETSRSDCSL